MDVTAICATLLSFTSQTPRQGNEELIQLVLTRRSQDEALVAKSLCHAAIAWKDASLWVRAVSNCSKDIGFSIFPHGNQSIWDAILSLGFEPIQQGSEVFCMDFFFSLTVSAS